MKRVKIPTWVQEGLLLAAIVLILTLPRGLRLGRYIFIDETFYIKHSAQFYWALANQEYDKTDLVVHPGVTTHWLGAAAFWHVYPEYAEDQPESEIHDLTFRRTLEAQDLSLLLMLIWARRFVVLFNSAMLVLAYLLSRRLFPTWLAVLGILLAGFDPFFFDHSRFLHVDGMMTVLMFVSVLAFLLYLKEGRIGWMLLSAVAAGLSVLSKVPGIVLLGFIGLYGLMEWIWPRHKAFSPKRSWKGLLKLSGVVLIWLLVVLLVIFLLWPAMWSDPVSKLAHIAEFVLDQGGAEMISPMFFNGAQNPTGVFGWDYANYYLLSYLWRASPVTMVGLGLLAAAFFARKRLDLEDIPWDAVLKLLLFVLIFVFLMTASVKKFDRYILPILMPLNLLAAVGFYAVVKSAAGMIIKDADKQYLRQITVVLIFAVIAGFQGLLVYQAFPYGLSYYNPWMGGGEKATEVMMVGYGEGLDQAAEYLMTIPDKRNLTIYSFYSNVFGFHYYQQIEDMPWYAKNFKPEIFDADYWIIYQSQKQRGMSPPALDYVEGHQPEFTVVINGIEYAWVYNLAEIRGAEGE